MSDGYCKDHQRVELIGNKCPACGEIEYPLLRKEQSDLARMAMLSGIIIVFLLAVIVYQLLIKPNF